MSIHGVFNSSRDCWDQAPRVSPDGMGTNGAKPEDFAHELRCNENTYPVQPYQVPE